MAAHPTSPSTSASTPCTGGEVRGLVDRFVRTFNAGNRKDLDALWSTRGQGFGWYSTDGPGQRFGSTASDRATLGGYFARRHAAGEHLSLTSFQFTGNTATYGNFAVRLVRRAADLPPTAYVGKGSVFCQDSPRTIFVWSMATDPTIG